MKTPKADGAAGARWAIALLGKSLCAETSSATMAEEGAKVDLKVSFRHVFQKGKLLTIHVQVKSGKSYGEIRGDGIKLTSNIDKETLLALSGSVSPGVIVWIPPDSEAAYWYSCDPRRPKYKNMLVSKLQFVSPSMRYDLTRLYVYASWAQSYPLQMVKKTDDQKTVLDQAKTSYSELKQLAKTNKLFHPLVGRVEVTRHAWRRATRKSKSARLRTRSLKVLPYLKCLIPKTPDRYVCNRVSCETVGKQQVETRNILCWYPLAFSIDGKTQALLIRFQEVIKYPSDWHRRPLSESDVSRVVKLDSWWYKEETKQKLSEKNG